MKQLAFNARLLKQNDLIEDTWFRNAAVMIKHDGKFHKITHETDLHRLFNNFQDFSFDRDFCDRVVYENPEFRELKELDDLDGAWGQYTAPENVAAAVRVTDYEETIHRIQTLSAGQ